MAEINYRDFVSQFDQPLDIDPATRSEEKPPAIEIVVDAKTGRPRQAGAVAEGRYITEFRERAEGSLFAFAKGVLGLTRLTKALHREVCRLATKVPPYRRMFLLPRDHLKTSIFSRAMPIHMLVQSKERNIYRPGIDGASTRILLSNETATNAEHFLRWIEGRFETNRLLRALWPHRCWENARRDARKWNEKEMTIPREDDYPEASIETIGVGGAVTSRHYNVHVKDDLISIAAANSQLVMQDAIQWHIASRALMDDPDKSLEYIVGTRWAAMDLYSFIVNGGALGASGYEPDRSVETYIRSAIEDGESIFPEMFSLDSLYRIQRELGPALFTLLYMNSTANPELSDFDMEELRKFTMEHGNIVFDEDPRDVSITEEFSAKDKPPVPQDMRGVPLNKNTYDMIMGRGEFLRLRYG